MTGSCLTKLVLEISITMSHHHMEETEAVSKGGGSETTGHHRTPEIA